MKKRMKKRIKVILLIFILLMLAAAGIFVFQNGGKISKTSKKPDGNGENSVTKSTSDEENRNTEENGADPDTIVKENVKVITRDTEAEKQPIEVFENSMTFSEDPGYQEGDILVAGQISAAQNGFLRKVVRGEKTNQGYWIETEQATLLDVFEQAHIVRQFQLTEDGAEGTKNSSKYTATKLLNTNGRNEKKNVVECSAGESDIVENNDIIKDNAQEDNAENDNTENNVVENDESTAGDETDDGTEEDTEESEYDYSVSLETEEDPVHFSGEAGWGCWLEIQIDIEDGEIQCGIAVKNRAGVSFQCGADSEQEFGVEKSIYQKKLPNKEFTVGGVPIVITNNLEAIVGAEGKLEGGISSSYSATAHSTLGFQYSSKTGKVEEIKEGELNSDGLEWSTMEVKGNLTAYLDLHLVSKLYDCAGLDLSGGVAGEAEGQAKVSVKDDLGGYAGALDLAIRPRIKGKVVVDAAVIDDDLHETELFEKTFDPIWSKHWESSADWQKDLEWTETGEQGDIYVTRYGEVNNNPATAFQFEIPRGWEIQTEEVGGPMDIVEENVVLANDRGVTVSFWSCQQELGGYSRSMVKAEISEADTSDFVPGYPWGTDRDCSDLGEFMVARVHVIGEMMAGIDEDYEPADSTFFAVVPTSYLGEREFAGQAGFVDEFSFDYVTPVAFIAESPDGTFSVKEEKDVIRILKSFKVAEME